MKKTWATINETLNRSKNITAFPSNFMINNLSVEDPQEIANHFNRFFIDVGSDLSNKIVVDNASSKFTDYLTHPTNLNFNFNLTTEIEILTIINKFKNKNSSGVDEISNKLLKAIKHEIKEPLSVIINQSLRTGIYPDSLKIAKVKPLYKKGEKNHLNNYRPISILPTISKVFERLMFGQIYNYFNTNRLLCEQQYGFRSGHSTELATVKLIDTIIQNMDNTRITKTPVTVCLDLSKAFDTLNFDILLHKLQYYGVNGVPLLLIKSYLNERYQYTKYDNFDSTRLEIKTGIPQGSILGPLFFSIYINDLINSSNKFKFLMYADDTTLYFNLEDFPAQNRSMLINNELERVNTWLKLNKLTLNVEKTKGMIFHKRRKIEHTKSSMNNRTIDIVSQFSFLGVILDEHLSWKEHVNMVTNKLSQISGVINRLKYVFPKQILKNLYKSLFTPHLNYGSLVWGTNTKQTEILQKRILRIITSSSYIAHTEPILKELGLINVKDMFSLKIINFFAYIISQYVATIF